mmetsp:Transcript_123992/g.355933  ORF Transcript_123992/g.355933 Transcript_123992/m.355933 type:complete len:157 (-) Transcript_123992:111-581(-)
MAIVFRAVAMSVALAVIGCGAAHVPSGDVSSEETCALQTQTRASAVHAHTEKDECDGEFVGPLRGVAPDCISACSECCKTLDVALGKYVKSRDFAEPKIDLCANLEKVKCLFTSEKCKDVTTEARKYIDGFPKHFGQLESECPGASAVRPMAGAGR